MSTTTMRKLKAQALLACQSRGHRMIPWLDYSRDNAVTHCQRCGKEVQCLTRPDANQIDIGGEAVALGCRRDGAE